MLQDNYDYNKGVFPLLVSHYKLFWLISMIAKGEPDARYYFNYFVDLVADRRTAALAVQRWMGICTLWCFDFDLSYYRDPASRRQDLGI